MRIALIGYGRMGRAVASLAESRGHQISNVITRRDNPGPEGFAGPWVRETDVVVDFSVAEAVFDNVGNAVRAKLPIVVGTTGWQARLAEVRGLVEKRGGACVVSSNFSIGVQVLFQLVRRAAQLLARFPEYAPFIFEAHHQWKRDTPSGTALTARTLLETHYSDVSVASLRVGYVIGEHQVGFDSPVDTLTLIHRAKSREGFAAGALYAAEWIQGRRGFYKFEDIIAEGDEQ